MSIKRLDVECYLEYDYSELLEKMTDDEIDDVVNWCNKLINEQQKIENDIISKTEDIISEAKEKLAEFYPGAFDTNFINFNTEDLSDGYGVNKYTIRTAVEKLRSNFPFFENLDNNERDIVIDAILQSLDETGAYWD